jgi:predicted transcriptional regulator
VSKRNRIITLKQNKNMEAKEKVLATMKEAGTPLNAGKIAELSGLDKKEVEKAMKQLKEEGAIVSPVRCKWAPAE